MVKRRKTKSVMIVKTIKLLLIIAFSLPLYCLGQSKAVEKKDNSDYPLKLFRFIDAVNQSINSLFEKEKAANLYRNLGYFEHDIHEYLDARSILIEQIKQGKFNVNESKSRIAVLRAKLSKLKTRFNVIKVDVENSIQDGNKIVRDTDLPLRHNASEVLTPLDDLINGHSSGEDKQVQLKKILKESENIREAFDKVITSIISARNKLKEKFNL